MNDSIGEHKCLGEACPNHCCTEKFRGLDASVDYESTKSSGTPLLDEDEYKRIKEYSGDKYIDIIDGKPYLKVYDNNLCSAYLNGRCAIYEVRPDCCKIYPFYFDQACGLCKDKNCPGNFTLDDISDEHYELLMKRLKLYQNERKNNK